MNWIYFQIPYHNTPAVWRLSKKNHICPNLADTSWFSNSCSADSASPRFFRGWSNTCLASISNPTAVSKIRWHKRKAKMSFRKFWGEQGSCFSYSSLPRSLALWISFTQGSFIRILRDKLREETIHNVIDEHWKRGMPLTHLACALPNVRDYHVQSKRQELECVRILWQILAVVWTELQNQVSCRQSWTRWMPWEGRKGLFKKRSAIDVTGRRDMAQYVGTYSFLICSSVISNVRPWIMPFILFLYLVLWWEICYFHSKSGTNELERTGHCIKHISVCCMTIHKIPLQPNPTSQLIILIILVLLLLHVTMSKHFLEGNELIEFLLPCLLCLYFIALSLIMPYRFEIPAGIKSNFLQFLQSFLG